MTTLRPVPGTEIRSASDLGRAWEALMGPGGFAGRSIWVALLDADDLIGEGLTSNRPTR